MHRAFLLGLAVFVGFATAGAPLRADWVELANSDVVQGEILSLDGKSLKLKSENFGEMTIPREKVTLIGLGERPVPQPQASVPRPAPQGAGVTPPLNDPQVDQLLQQALGGGGIGQMKQQMGQTAKGLKELQKDLGPGPEADALNSYIQMFELFGKMNFPSGSAAQDSPQQTQPQSGTPTKP